MNVGILGDGSMAKAIGYLLQKNAVEFEVFSRKNGNIEGISKANTIFLCVPSNIVVEYTNVLQLLPIIVSCAKGIVSIEKPFISSFFDESQFCVLSGPNFSAEILSDCKTITTIASKNDEILSHITKLLASSIFEIENTNEVRGVEICGIVKNVIAIMMGYASVKMPSWNEKSLLLTKMFQEISQILEYFHCDTKVLNLSCGIGDIFLTCSSVNSRNYKFGIDLANGIKNGIQTVEGLRSLDWINNIPLDLPYLRYIAKLSVVKQYQ